MDEQMESREITEAEWTKMEAKAREIGAEHGNSAAQWWEQDAIGGRTTGDPTPTATRVLRGIEDGDPEIYDSLPSPDLSGQWADSYTSNSLIEDCASEVDIELGDERLVDGASDLCDAYEEAFRDACEAEIVRQCKAAL